MKHSPIESELTHLLREKILRGSTRDISLEEPLGHQGLGLDSLALVDFVTTVENQYNKMIPETIWMQRGQITIKNLASLLAELPDSTSQLPKSADFPVNGIPLSRKIPIYVKEYGVSEFVVLMVKKLLRCVMNLIYEQSKYHILSFDLQNQSIPTVPVPTGIRFREVELEDLNAVDGLWVKSKHKEKCRLFRERLRKNYMGLAACQKERIIALDWVTDSENWEPDLGVFIVSKTGSCFGLDLNEHPGVRGRGVGIATLARCLQMTKQKGYRAHTTMIHQENQEMLRTCIQLLGFEKIGEIRVQKYLGKPFPRWTVNGLSGNENVIVF